MKNIDVASISIFNKKNYFDNDASLLALKCKEDIEFSHILKNIPALQTTSELGKFIIFLGDKFTTEPRRVMGGEYHNIMRSFRCLQVVPLISVNK